MLVISRWRHRRHTLHLQ